MGDFLAIKNCSKLIFEEQIMFMTRTAKKAGIVFIYLILASLSISSAQTKVTIQAGRPGAQISPTMYGIFFEDINFGADGGLYSELVKNRSFEFPDGLMGWSKLQREGAQGTLSVRDDEPFITGKTYGEPGNSHYLRIEVKEPGKGFGVTNEGFRGMGLQKGKKYWFSVYARSLSDEMSFTVEVIAEDGRKITEGRFGGIKGNWMRCPFVMEALDTDKKATLNFIVTSPGTLDIDMVSLFPEDSAVSDPSTATPIPGLRKDIVQMLADMKPGFLRFPGGCIVEGYDLSLRYQWKNTIGDISQRKLIKNRWNTEFRHRLTTDYYQTFGLGFFEYFKLSEEIGAEPMPILNCGMACQFNSGELAPMDQLGPYVQDMLDLIEFANGPPSSKWGKVRAEMGHPEPFNMKMIGVGNEQWGPQYIERYKVFAKAIKDKYPEMQLIAATGSDATIFPNGHAEIEYLWKQWRQLKPEFVDEHFYRQPDWFLENVNWYDDYDRTSPKLFVGEYAAQSVGVASPDNRNNLKCALYEAAFMTGMERNADLVRMTCYAPLFGQEDAWQWRPDMIWFDNLNVYGSANYYVQKLFSLNPGTNLLNVRLKDVPELDDNKKALSVSSTFDKKAGEVIIKAVNVTDKGLKANIELQGVSKAGPQAKAIVLAGKTLEDENTLQEPKKIYPVEKTVPVKSPNFSYEFQPYSLTVLRIPME
jgi:alpha-N-arabinofuranosidase